MRRIVAALLMAAAPLMAEQAAPDDSADGPALAERIRNAIPEENNQIQGRFIIRANGQTTTVLVRCQITIHDTNWQTEYDVAATTNSGAEKLIIIHRTNAPNEYLYARAGTPSTALPELTRLSSATAATTALAGSDFSAADLGLDFLHWPQQRRLKGEMRLGQPCYVLESSGPRGEPIVRVKSYIDKESSGLLIAEGYNAEEHLIKEFSLHGSSFKKVNGHWRLEKMDIRDNKKHSHTELKFDILDK